MFAMKQRVVTVIRNGDSVGVDLPVPNQWQDFLTQVRTVLKVSGKEKIRIYSERMGLVEVIDALKDERRYYVCVGDENLVPLFDRGRRGPDPSTFANVRPKRAFQKLKMIILGDHAVGKSSWLGRFAEPDEPFRFNQIATIGIDYKVRTIETSGQTVKVFIYDTAGQERYRSIVSAYFKDVAAVLLMYDVTNRTSFQGTRVWMTMIEKQCPSTVVTFLIGNKQDLANSGSQNCTLREVLCFVLMQR
jgi:small GTP-binding protein